MLGIFKGMGITIRHFLGRRWTNLYPYEKPQLPERSRGLIQLVVEPETKAFKCEACLLCEKACPPRAISIQYSRRDPFRPFRKRPPLRDKTISGFYRPRLVQGAEYAGARPMSFAVAVPADGRSGPEESLAKLEGILSSPREDSGLLPVLEDVQAAFGYLPRWALERVASEASLPVSDLYSMVTLSPQFRLRPAAEGGLAGE
ncbi:MAG: NAD(P)H-dependent oxidoreductase subunit E [Chloroflexi bacterium]|nr:NAD(P)H-dependent oxidoreductase subunit E [Chloroflexota bacterium]